MNAKVKKTPDYKERIEKIEKEILAITNIASYAVFSGDDAAYLLTLLNDRKWLLDAMFVVTPEEFAPMNEVNERLRELTHELHHQVPMPTRRRSVRSSVRSSRLRLRSNSFRRVTER